MKQEQVLLSAFSFDELNAKKIPARRQSAMDKWLLANPDKWRVAETRLELDLLTQQAVIIKGEEGVGKTTELRMLNEDILQLPDTLPLWLDFTSCPEGDFNATMPGFIRQQLQSAMRDADLFMEYRAALLRLQLQQDFHSFYDLLHEARGDFSRWKDDRILTDPRIKTASAIYEAAMPHVAHLLALKAVQELSRRAYLLVDNTDLLGRSRVQRLARLLSGSMTADTYLLATTRPENYASWARGANERRDLHTVDLHSSSDRLFKIAHKRLDSALEFVRTFEPRLLQETSTTVRRLEQAITDIQGDHIATSLVSDWHNRSVRQMLPSLAVTAIAYAQKNPNESLNGVVFRTLVRHAMPESLVDIYTPEYPVTTHREFFVFLKLRLLAYLYKHRADENTPTLNQVKSDFSRAFGVKGFDTEKALRELAERDDAQPEEPLSEEPSEDTGRSTTRGSGLVRIEELDKDPQVRSVILLSAGRCMIELVVTSCDFLSWVYEHSRSVNAVPRREGATISQLKLDKAVEVTRSHILPLFLLEHPYMEKGLDYFAYGRPDKQTVERLSRYRTMFGYYPRHWFIASLRDGLKKYADSRLDRIMDREPVDELVELCDRYVENLDAVALAIPHQGGPLPPSG